MKVASCPASVFVSPKTEENARISTNTPPEPKLMKRTIKNKLANDIVDKNETEWIYDKRHRVEIMKKYIEGNLCIVKPVTRSQDRG